MLHADFLHRADLSYALAAFHLALGKPEKSIDALWQILKSPNSNKLYMHETEKLQELLALAYFRLGEQENCINRHNVDSCIYPLSGRAIYEERSATQKAIQEFQMLSRQNLLERRL